MHIFYIVHAQQDMHVTASPLYAVGACAARPLAVRSPVHCQHVLRKQPVALIADLRARPMAIWQYGPKLMPKLSHRMLPLARPVVVRILARMLIIIIKP